MCVRKYMLGLCLQPEAYLHPCQPAWQAPVLGCRPSPGSLCVLIDMFACVCVFITVRACVYMCNEMVPGRMDVPHTPG